MTSRSDQTGKLGIQEKIGQVPLEILINEFSSVPASVETSADVDWGAKLR